jgi:hypothetical protein
MANYQQNWGKNRWASNKWASDFLQGLFDNAEKMKAKVNLHDDETGIIEGKDNMKDFRLKLENNISKIGELVKDEKDATQLSEYSIAKKELQDILVYINALEKSKGVKYFLKESKSNSEYEDVGITYYDTDKKGIVIEFPSFALLAHEICHAHDFEKGKVAYRGESGKLRLDSLYSGHDMFKEINAYKKQYAFGTLGKIGHQYSYSIQAFKFDDINADFLQSDYNSIIFHNKQFELAISLKISEYNEILESANKGSLKSFLNEKITKEDSYTKLLVKWNEDSKNNSKFYFNSK